VSSPNLSDIVDDYEKNYRRGAHLELDYFRRQPSLEDAVSRGAVARIQGTKLPHQWRLKDQVLEQSRARLLDNISVLRRAKSFDDLHDVVEAVIGSLPGIGPLTVYDTTLRVGAHRGLLPTKIYLHAGTRIGAKRLGLAWKQRTLETTTLPQALRRLQAHEAEDVLCIYKDQFGAGSHRTVKDSSKCVSHPRRSNTARAACR
jgi:hypothetical protein